MIIEDGKGTGLKAQVDDENRLVTQSVMTPMIESINEDKGRMWSILFDALAPSGATVFFVIQNNGQSTIAVATLMLAASVAGVYRVAKVTGTPAGGTTVMPSNTNLNKTQQPDDILFESGTNITGLTEAYAIFPIYLAANVPFLYEIQGRLFMPPGTGISIKAPAAATVNGFVTVYEEP